MGIIDETSFVKQGKKTPACNGSMGTVGKQENGSSPCIWPMPRMISTVCSTASCFCRKAGPAERVRCREAKIPEGMTYRPKTEIALELYDRAAAKGIHFAWLTFDEWYGGKPAFLQALDRRQQGVRGRSAADLDGLD